MQSLLRSLKISNSEVSDPISKFDKLVNLKKPNRLIVAFLALVMMAGSVNAQTAGSYSFTPTTGTYTSLTVSAGQAVAVTSIQVDDANATGIPLGFSFPYGGAVYSTVSVSSNGWLSFANASPNTSLSVSNALKDGGGSARPLVAPLWDDLSGLTTGIASYQTTGTSPNRVFTFEWKNWKWNYNATAAVISFQVKLYETTGVVEFWYRQEAGTITLTGTGYSSGASIGLAGTATGNGNYLSLNNTSASPTASSTTETLNLTTKPATGQIYRFTPSYKIWIGPANGDFNTGTNWLPGGVPTSTDALFIPPGSSPVVSSAASAGSITFTNTGATSSSLTVNSILTVTQGITLQNAAAGNTSASLAGSGTINCTSIDVGGNVTSISSDQTTTLTSTISALSISGNLTIFGVDNGNDDNNASFNLASGSVTVGGTAILDADAGSVSTLTLATGAQTGTLLLSGVTPFSISGGGTKTFTLNGTNATVNYTRSGTQTVLGTTYTNLTLAGTGAGNNKTISTGTIVNGTLSMQGTAAAITNAVTFGSNATLEYKGSAAQTTTSIEFPSSNGPKNLTIDNTNGVTLHASRTITGTLTFTSGKITTNANTLTLGNTATVSGAGAGKYVNGNLEKIIAAGTTTINFEIGDATVYAPVSIAFAGTITNSTGAIKASTSSGDHAQISTSGIDGTKSVNRTWTLVNTATINGVTSYSPTFNFVSTDVDAGANTANFVIRRYVSPNWFTTTIGIRTLTSTQATGVIGVGDFQIGEPFPAPTITCNGNLSLNNINNTCAANVTLAQLTGQVTIGGSPAPTLSFSPSAGSFPVGTTAVTATVTNINGSTNCSFNVIISDAQAPTITTCAPAQSANANASCQAAVPNFTGGVTATDNCTATGSLVKIQVPAAGTLVSTGTTNVVITVKDASNNATTCTTTFTVTDIIAPTITACAPAQSANANASCQAAVPNFTGGVTATDNCTAAGSLVITQVPAAGTLVSTGTTNVVITVKDASNNATTCTTTFTVTDIIAPTITACAPAQSANANASCQAAVPNFTGGVTATDNCTATGSLVITQVPAAGTLVSTGVTNVVITVKDASNNATTCTTTFTVTDIIAPTITACAPAQSANANASCQAAVPNFTGGVTATDNCTATGSLVITQVPAAGTLVSTGVTNVVITVKDASNNATTCTTTFTVTDIIAPTITACAPAQSANANASCQAAVPNFTGGVTATDNCTATGSLVITQVPAAGTLVSTGTTNVVITVKDASNNATTCTTTFTVTDIIAPTITACAPAQSANANASCQAAVPNFTGGVTATDNCTAAGSLVITQVPAAGTLVSTGTTNVVITVKDASNNATTCTTTFTVTDIIAPTITACAPAQSANANASCQAAVPNFTGGVTATDNCTATGSLVITQVPAAGTLVSTGVTNVVITVKDASNNATTCTTTFTVTDIIAPTITACAPAQSANANASCQAAVPNFTGGVTATDNCTAAGSLVITQVPAAGTLVSTGTTNVVITVKDASNNATTCNTTFTVNDVTPPSITTCASGQSANATTNCQAAVPNFIGGITASDNCTASGSLVITQVPAAGTLVSPGITTVVITVKDASNNATTCNTTFTVIETWKGITADWNNGSNWCSGSVPGATTNIFIPTSPVGGNQPVIIAPAANGVHNITIASGASLTLNYSGTDTAVLTITGAYSNSGILANNGKIILQGDVAQSFPGGSVSNPLMNTLEINNTLGVSADRSFTIRGKLFPTTGTLALGASYITLKSDSSNVAGTPEYNTARVGVVGTGASFTYGTGRFVIERYFHSKRAWRLITAPIAKLSSPTIYNSWQLGGRTTTTPAAQGGPAPAGSGVLITGPTPTGPGIDPGVNSQYSLKTYNSFSGALVPVANTQLPLLSPGTPGSTADNIGYFNFVRGDRNPALVGAFSTATDTTTLRDTGRIQIHDQTFTFPLAGGTGDKFILLANPYASPIDFSAIYLANSSTIQDKFWAWDPSSNQPVGSYVEVFGDGFGGNYTVVPTSLGGQTQYIQSCQAVYVQTTNASTASVIIKEDFKSDATVKKPLFRPLIFTTAQLATNLKFLNADNTTALADGVLAQFSSSFSNAVDQQDGLKFPNVNESFAVAREGRLLTVERRNLLTQSDTLFFNLTKAGQRSYQLEFVAEGLEGNTAYLEDSYLKTSTPVNMSGTTTVNFSINAEAASGAANRFRLVFRPAAPLPLTFTRLKAYQQAGNINVEWTVDGERNMKQYEVERSSDGSRFVKIATAPALHNNGRDASYTSADAAPFNGVNYYRIHSISRSGEDLYSNVVKVTIGRGAPQISVYPNPIVNGTINLQLTNQPEGSYGVKLLNKLGQVLMTKEITHAAGSSTETLHLSKAMAHGIYQLEVTSPGKIKKNINVIY